MRRFSEMIDELELKKPPSLGMSSLGQVVPKTVEGLDLTDF